MSDIQFDTIPDSMRKPGVHFEFSTRLAVGTLPGNTQRVLVIGPMLATGTATPLNAVSVFSEDEAARYFGAGSLAANMAAAAMKANDYLQLDVIGIPDGTSGQPATGAVKVDGQASSSGTLSVRIAGETVTINVEAGDEPAKIIPSLVKAMEQQPALLVSGEYKAEGAQLALTARTKGEWGNGITLSASTTASGLTLTPTPMANGELDPDIQPALDAVFAAGHNILICPFSTDAALSALKQHLDKTGGALEQRGAVGCAGW
ncbi:phage tail protein, partial [Citrobacter portucalensis]|nr:phage tail protein [Citrobacter portucalensis]